MGCRTLVSKDNNILNDSASFRSKFSNLYPDAVYVWYPAGWAIIVERMTAALVGRRVALIEVKEKYALLIIRYDPAMTDSESVAVIKGAEAEAEVTCDRCRARGVMREDDDGWLSVRCDDDADDAEPISVRYADVLARTSNVKPSRPLTE